MRSHAERQLQDRISSSSCAGACPTGKQMLTREVARERAKQRRRKWHERVGEYRCHHCGTWHIGHRFRLRRSA